MDLKIGDIFFDSLYTDLLEIINIRNNFVEYRYLIKLKHVAIFGYSNFLELIRKDIIRKPLQKELDEYDIRNIIE